MFVLPAFAQRRVSKLSRASATVATTSTQASAASPMRMAAATSADFRRVVRSSTGSASRLARRGDETPSLVSCVFCVRLYDEWYSY